MHLDLIWKSSSLGDGWTSGISYGVKERGAVLFRPSSLSLSPGLLTTECKRVWRAAICRVYRFPKFETETRSFQADVKGSSAINANFSSAGDLDFDFDAAFFLAVFLGGWEEPGRGLSVCCFSLGRRDIDVFVDSHRPPSSIDATMKTVSRS
jgi:hypothetical protein